MVTNASSPNQPAAAAAISPPWSQIVAAASHANPSSHSPPPSPIVVDSSSVTSTVNTSAVAVNTSTIDSPVAENLDNTFGVNNADIGKKQVWNKPSNAAASSSVVDAESWPALSESAKAPAKSPPLQALVKPSLDVSTTSQLQGTGTGSMLPSPHRQVNDTASVNNTAQGSTHQRPFRRTNLNASSNGGHPVQTFAPQGSVASPTGNSNQNSAPRDHSPRAGFVPSDQPQHRNSFRNRNGGPHQRGDGSHHHNHGSRHDQDRGNQDWNGYPRNFNDRDNYRSPIFVSQFMRPPPSNHYYPAPPPLPFAGSFEYPDPLGGVPFVPARQPNVIYFQPPDIIQLHSQIVYQIDYYFSDYNLCKDVYLRNKMDGQGWVPLNLIAGFSRVKSVTDNIQIVLDAVRTSSVVEVHVQGDKLRRRNDWRRWILPSVPVPNVTGSQIGQLAENVQSIALETSKNDTAEGLDVSQRRPSGDSNSQYLISTCEVTDNVGVQDSDHAGSAKS